jgi:hypothetical protein
VNRAAAMAVSNSAGCPAARLSSVARPDRRVPEPLEPAHQCHGEIVAAAGPALLDGTVPGDEIRDMVTHSYRRVVAALPGATREPLLAQL